MAASGNGVGGPAARVALRGRLGRRALRPPAPGAVHARRDAAGEAAFAALVAPPRADGPGRLPAAPRRPPPRRGRLPGRLPRPGAEGAVDPRPRPAGQLALRRRAPHGALRPAPARPPSPERGGRHHDARRLDRPVEPTVPPADEAVDGPRAGRGAARRDRAPARGLPPAGRALLPRGPHRPRGGAAAPMAARHGPQPLARAREKLRRGLDAPRRRAARRRTGRGARLPIRLGVRLIPPVRYPRPGPRSASRPDRPPARPSRPRRRPWPGRS